MFIRLSFKSQTFAFGCLCWCSHVYYHFSPHYLLHFAVHISCRWPEELFFRLFRQGSSRFVHFERRAQSGVFSRGREAQWRFGTANRKWQYIHYLCLHSSSLSGRSTLTQFPSFQRILHWFFSLNPNLPKPSLNLIRVFQALSSLSAEKEFAL